MSFFDPRQPWGAPGRQPSWEQQISPSRSGATSAASNEPFAFLSQLEEVERAVDNLVKSGKHHPGIPASAHGASSRRDSLPVLSRPHSEYDNRTGGSGRHHSISEYDGGRSGSSAGLQGYYASQRYQPKQEPDQMLQAKRRMAAQREKELRNYHQEQQYNRNVSSVKSDRSMSPNAMSEDERRDLIARQHRALYGNEPAHYHPDNSAPRSSQDARLSISAGPRGPSPLAFDPFGSQQPQSSVESVQMPPRDQGPTHMEGRSSTSPTSAARSNFGLSDSPPQATPAASATSPTTSPSIGPGNMPSIATQSGVAPIGTRPAQTNYNKRSTTPNERSTSATSDPAEKAPGLGWGSSSGVWGGPKNSLGVHAQASVWG